MKKRSDDFTFFKETNMLSKQSLLLVVSSFTCATSFSVVEHRNFYHGIAASAQRATKSKTFLYESSPEGSAESEKSSGIQEYKIPFEEGSQDELMFALGVNLARQLGDIRPLVEDGNELAQVAKGILDCVVGRLEDEEQRNLLARRGKDLNDLIVGRADNLRKKVEDMGRNMLKEMSETEGCITLDSGVVIHPLEPGPGK